MSVSVPMCKILTENGAQCSHPTVGNSDFCWFHGDWFTADLEIFRMVDQHFREDLSKFWQRSNFYLVAEAALFSAFVSIAQRRSGLDRNLIIIVSLIGLILTAFWYAVGARSLAWLKLWREQRIALSERFDRYQHHAQVERVAQVHPWRTSTQITKFLPLLFAVAWLALLAAYLIR